MEIVPAVELPPVTPFTRQVTPVLELPVTVAVNCLVWPVATLAEVGEMVTEICGGAVLLLPAPLQAERKNPVKAKRNTQSRRRMDSFTEGWKFLS